MVASIDLHDRHLAYTMQERITCIRGIQEVVIRRSKAILWIDFDGVDPFRGNGN